MSSPITAPALESALRWLYLAIQDQDFMPQPKHRRPQESFGKRLASLRKLRGLTQRALSTESRVSQRMIAYYETHDATPPGDTVSALARALGVAMDDLLGLKPTPKQAPASTAELRLWKKFRQLQSLPEAKRRAVLQVLEQLIDDV